MDNLQQLQASNTSLSDIDVTVSHNGLANGNVDSVTDSSTFDVTSADSDPSSEEQEMSNTVTSLTPDSDSQSQADQLDNTVLCNGGSVNVSPGLDSKSDNASQNKTSQTNSSFTMPRLDKSDWYTQSCFKKYWRNYNQAMSWCRKHLEVTQKLSQKTAKRQHIYDRTPPTNMSYNPYNPYQHLQSPYPYSYPGYFQGWGSHQRGGGTRVGQGRGRGLGRGRGRGQRNNASPRPGNTRKVKQQRKTENESEVYEMEITDEMKDFFVISEQHKKEREAKRIEKEKEAHVSLEGAAASKKVPTSEAPKERPGARRTTEMVQLYGKGAAMIHGMETALQMTYDRSMDVRQPKYWPNMPLKIVFSKT